MSTPKTTMTGPVHLTAPVGESEPVTGLSDGTLRLAVRQAQDHAAPRH